MSTGNLSSCATSLSDVLPQTVAVMEEGIARRLHLGVQVYISQHGQVIADGAVGKARPEEALTSTTTEN